MRDEDELYAALDWLLQRQPAIEDPPSHQREHEVAAAIAIRPEDAIKADLVSGTKHCSDMTVRQRSNHGESIALGGNDGAAFEHTAQAFDMSGRPIREIAQRALSHLAVLAVTLAQQDGGRRVPVRHGFNIHGATSAQATREYKRQNLDYMATLWMRLRTNRQSFQHHRSIP